MHLGGRLVGDVPADPEFLFYFAAPRGGPKNNFLGDLGVGSPVG